MLMSRHTWAAYSDAGLEVRAGHRRVSGGGEGNIPWLEVMMLVRDTMDNTIRLAQ